MSIQWRQQQYVSSEYLKYEVFRYVKLLMCPALNSLILSVIWLVNSMDFRISCSVALIIGGMISPFM